MAKVLVVTSGKGGVGKTTSTAALGAALATAGKNVVVVDFDVGLRNLDLVMGCEPLGDAGQQGVPAVIARPGRLGLQ
ncbi:MAG: P-loop NTPase, partial [Gammaproteobacteria bacterium]